MNNIISNAGFCVRNLVYNGTVGFAEKLRNVGIIRGCNKVYSLQGFAALTKAVDADLRFLALLPNMENVFKEMQKSVEEQRAIVYGTQFIETLHRFVTKGFRDNRGHFLIPDALIAIGSFCDLGKFLQRRDLLPNEQFFSRLATQMGNWKVYLPKNTVLQPFSWPVLSALTTTPKDFFIFSAAAYDFGRYSVRVGQTICGHHLNEYRDLNEQQNVLYSVDHAVKQFTNMGKIVLIGLGSVFGKQYNVLFTTINLVVQNVGLFSFIVKPLK